MPAILAIIVISGGGVAFFIRFFVALCKETNGRRRCHATKMLPESNWNIEAEAAHSVRLTQHLYDLHSGTGQD